MAKKTKLKTREVSAETQIDETEKSTSQSEDIFSTDGELVVDVFETGSHFTVVAPIAGVQIKDIDISIEEDLMIIKGDRKAPASNIKSQYLYQECYWGPFSKKIVLPENINTEEADAQMDKGILTITIPKTT